jgi:hypothetical protein
MNIRSYNFNQLAAFHWSCQKSRQELDEQKFHKTMGIHNCTQKGKGTYKYARVLCQKNKGSVEIK